MIRAAIPLVVALLLAACVPVVSVSPLPTPTSAAIRTAAQTPTPKQGTGLVVGQLVGQPAKWAGRPLTAYAAPFKPTTPGSGFFVLEPSIHPRASLNASGVFQIRDVPAEAYVIVIGPTPEDALAIQEGGIPKVVQVQADQTLDLGKIEFK